MQKGELWVTVSYHSNRNLNTLGMQNGEANPQLAQSAFLNKAVSLGRTGTSGEVAGMLTSLSGTLTDILGHCSHLQPSSFLNYFFPLESRPLGLKPALLLQPDPKKRRCLLGPAAPGQEDKNYVVPNELPAVHSLQAEKQLTGSLLHPSSCRGLAVCTAGAYQVQAT